VPAPAGITIEQEALPLVTVPVVQLLPRVGMVNVTAPSLTVPPGLVTVALRIAVCEDVEKVTDALETIVVVADCA
jgi:hypothetical protein